MLLVATRLDVSPLIPADHKKKIGLFADELIPAGTKIWEFTKGIDKEVSETNVNKLPKLQKDFANSQYPWTEKYYLIYGDNTRFINHSEEPNVGEEGDYLVALKDIQVGEELVSDYRTFEENFEEFKAEYFN
jgi:SET domain-containing protein